MSPNYEDQSTLSVSRWIFAEPTPKRGDVVSAFMDEEDPHKTYLKRIVGVQGDVIKMTIDGLLFSVNDQLVHYSDVNDDTTFVHKLKNDNDDATLANAAYSKAITESYLGLSYDVMFLYSPTSARGTYGYLERKKLTGYYDKFTYDHNGLATIIVPKNHYFLLSDNRPSGKDSRVTGFLHTSKIYRVVDEYDYN